MKPTILFVIPVRHFSNIKDPENAARLLSETVASINSQTSEQWSCSIVANKGTKLPPLPEKCEVVYVDFPPNQNHERKGQKKEAFLDAVRLDKGRRVVSGIINSPKSDYVMIVDDDDLVHRHLVAYASENLGDNGWYIGDGYVWREGDKVLTKENRFSALCGSSHIIRTDLLNVPSSLDEISDERIKNDFGSHTKIKEKLENASFPLKKLPFYGAVYRIGHLNSHSGSSHSWLKYFFDWEVLSNPRQLYWNIKRVKLINKNLKRDFFGG